MALMKEEKQQILQKFRRGELDTGSPEVQVALLTFQIRKLTEHFKIYKKDVHGRRGLAKKVSRRRKILDYLHAKDAKRYEALITELAIRK